MGDLDGGEIKWRNIYRANFMIFSGISLFQEFFQGNIYIHHVSASLKKPSCGDMMIVICVYIYIYIYLFFGCVTSKCQHPECSCHRPSLLRGRV